MSRDQLLGISHDGQRLSQAFGSQRESSLTSKQLELGEIGINANQDSPALYIKDSADVSPPGRR